MLDIDVRPKFPVVSVIPKESVPVISAIMAFMSFSNTLNSAADSVCVGIISGLGKALRR